MGAYELIFEVEELAEETQDVVYEHFDALISGHGRTNLVTLTAEGPTAASAARLAVAQLTALGVRPYRMVEDLATRAEIARRLNVAAQAVGQWIRGERRADFPFPEPYNRAGGGVWLWSDVASWVAKVPDLAKHAEPGLSFPRLEDYTVINFELLSARPRRSGPTSQGFTQAGSVELVSATVTYAKEAVSTSTTQGRTSERMGSWRDYGLAS
ncbi:MAG: hypothetical protein JHC71_06645 [Blastococcus sp.]|nr:hypothetical protein [Blastococcus sp.]